MSTAGQANEAGSVFRRDAAVYFAVHALIGRPVSALDGSRQILRLDFETPDPTDDIVLGLTGDATAYVSAKNRVDAGKSFRETVAGWVAQLDADMGAEDLLGLAFGSCASWVHDLAEGLRRLHAGQEVSRPAEVAALKKLDDLVPEGHRDEVRRRARLIQVPGSSVSGDTATVLEVLLGGPVEGDASLAVSALAGGLHTLAGSALGADVSALVGMLESAEGLTVRVGGGSPAAVEAATRAASDEYLDGFLSRRGRVNLPLLADDLAPVVVDGLYECLRVVDLVRSDERERSEDLGRIVRRRRRLLLVGQPGSGKSVATWEIAAECARDDDAPVPVRVHLPDLLPVGRVRDLTLADVIEVGARLGRESSRPLLEGYLAEAAAAGDVMLVLDGLDECRAEAAEMAEHLRRVVDALHPDAGVVLATRASAEVPAERLGLARLDLSRPDDLNSTMDAVLVECARVRVREEQRADWLAARRSWIRDVRDAQAGLVEVPQLALLVVLIVAESSELDVPKERAELLHAAVVRSVERWELTRFKGSGLEWAGDLTPRMLLDGFQVLGRMLDTVEKNTRADALARLTAMLVDERWDLAAGRAEELAEQVLKFWDEHVAVFTVDETGILSSRSRVFTEVATAMWTKTRDAEELEAWAKEALDFRDSEGVLGLAQGLNPSLVQTLLAMGPTDPEASLAVGAVVANGTIALADTDLHLLATQLMSHIAAVDAGELELGERRPRKSTSFTKMFGDRRGRQSWPLVRALCRLPLPSELQEERRVFVADLPAKGSDKVVLNAWVVLTDAPHDERELTDQEVETVQAAVDIEIPASEPLIKTSRRSFTVPTRRRAPMGIGSVALLAVQHLSQLSEPSPERIYRASMTASGAEHEAIARALRQAGVDITPWLDMKAFTAMVKNLSDRDYEQRLLEDIASLDNGQDAALLTKVDRWSLKDVGDLIFASGYPSVEIASFKTAFVADNREIRASWLKCVAVAYGVDVAAAAAQARHLLSEPESEFGRPHDWRTVSVRPAYKRESIEPDCLTSDQQTTLFRALEANSDWISWSAANMLAQTTPRWDTGAFFEADRSGWKPYRAMVFSLVAILASPNSAELLQRAANSADPAYRQAAECTVRADTALDPDGEVARKLSVDDDLTVRGDLDAGDPPPLHWSCNECGTVNDIEVVDCPGCEEGTRPSRKKTKEEDDD